MIFDKPMPQRSALRTAINVDYLMDETACLDRLLMRVHVNDELQQRISQRARQLVLQVREKGRGCGGIDAFLQEYDLSSNEGVVMMCLAEALLRIPDDSTADRLIQDKLSKGEWDKHFGKSHSLFVNASTWGLMLTGRLIKIEKEAIENPNDWLKRFVAHSGEPIVRIAMRQAMRIMGHQFVMGETIEDALKRSQSDGHKNYRYSFDMLGEAALTQSDADYFFNAYEIAIKQLAQCVDVTQDLYAAPSISIKLSALHPRYEFAQYHRVMQELTPKLRTLVTKAKQSRISLTVDAEESDRLTLSLDIFEAIFTDPVCHSWGGFGLAVQAYQKRAPAVLDWLIDMAKQRATRIPLRLVKGAYWDTEIKRAQEQGLTNYPVFTRKASTDVSYLACVQRLLAAENEVYAQFATHNAHTVAYIIEHAGNSSHFEFQRLHGMGETLYEEIIDPKKLGIPCRVYAPVGGHKELLPYLVRRLLENGANTSFVNRIVDDTVSIDDIICNPIAKMKHTELKPHPDIPLPAYIFGNSRKNSLGINFYDEQVITTLEGNINSALERHWTAAPLVAGNELEGKKHPIFDPADASHVVGTVINIDKREIDTALTQGVKAVYEWGTIPVETRAAYLDQVADRIEKQHPEFIALCVRESGKTIPDALGEVREAADFCRYYAMLARQYFNEDKKLLGPTGELNQLRLHGRGLFACISPWNFPLAIFVGQVAAALAAGNAVVAKPAGQTPLVAAHVVRLFHDVGIPGDVLQLLPGPGNVLGHAFAQDPRISGVAFTGSTGTAHKINSLLAARNGPIIPLIAETGGQNAMIVDSSALPDQVIVDVLRSAFNSAGQRCSALRVLFLQADIAPRVLTLLSGAIDELCVGDPAQLRTDVGPIIDMNACVILEQHSEYMSKVGQLIAQATVDDQYECGTFFAPRAFLIDDISILKQEIFGPILHVITYESNQLNQVIDAINNTGYGLTLGIHTRVDASAKYIASQVRVGNIYINRNMIGATVGVQPFGGQGLSGTGPKAGGPYSLFRYATERTLSTNTTALGGNASLLGLHS